MHFYAALPGSPGELQQGDMLENVPFSLFAMRQTKVSLSGGGSDVRDLSEDRGGVEFIVTRAEFSWGVLLSQTCDLQIDPETGGARKPIVIARVRPIKALVPNFKDDTVQQSLTAVEDLNNPRKRPTLFYFPAHRTEGVDFPRSGADLLDIQRFPQDDVSALLRLVRLHLSPPALQALQERCAYCFGRFAAPDGLFLTDQEWAEKQRKEKARVQSRLGQG